MKGHIIHWNMMLWGRLNDLNKLWELLFRLCFFLVCPHLCGYITPSALRIWGNHPRTYTPKVFCTNTCKNIGMMLQNIQFSKNLPGKNFISSELPVNLFIRDSDHQSAARHKTSELLWQHGSCYLDRFGSRRFAEADGKSAGIFRSGVVMLT